MEGIRIDLERWQNELLLPFFKKLEKMADEGKPGMILAQIIVGTNKKYAFLDVRLCDNEMGTKFQEITGISPGKVFHSPIIFKVTTRS